MRRLALFAAVAVAALWPPSSTQPQTAAAPAAHAPAATPPGDLRRLRLRLPPSWADTTLGDMPVARPPSNSEPYAPSEPGWFRGPDRAGWGVGDKQSEALAGVYPRPDSPNIPPPQIHGTDDASAVGVRLALKLGR